MNEFRASIFLSYRVGGVIQSFIADAAATPPFKNLPQLND